MIGYTGGVVTQSRTTTGDMADVIATGAFSHAIQVVKTDGGSPGAFSLTINGSLISEAGPWDAIGSAVTANNDIIQFQGIYRFIKIVVGTLATGDSVAVTYVGH